LNAGTWDRFEKVAMCGGLLINSALRNAATARDRT
jgi:hypothetical protein